MKTIEETILNAQNEWDALFSKHRLTFVTSVSTTTMNHLEHLHLQDIVGERVFFQKEHIGYQLICVGNRSHGYKDIIFKEGNKELFRIQPHPHVSYSLSGLDEDIEMQNDVSRVIPFFEDAYRWFVRNGHLLKSAKEQARFNKMKQTLVGKSIDDFIQTANGDWVILVEGKEFSVKKKDV